MGAPPLNTTAHDFRADVHADLSTQVSYPTRHTLRDPRHVVVYVQWLLPETAVTRTNLCTFLSDVD